MHLKQRELMYGIGCMGGRRGKKPGRGGGNAKIRSVRKPLEVPGWEDYGRRSNTRAQARATQQRLDLSHRGRSHRGDRSEDQSAYPCSSLPPSPSSASHWQDSGPWQLMQEPSRNRKGLGLQANKQEGQARGGRGARP